jgi:hypothetical protein
MTDKYQLISIFCARPQQFAWFLGAGTSAVAGLPTAVDVIWYLKLRYYCREENQKLSRQDLQIAAVRERIQTFMLSRGFPPKGEGRQPADITADRLLLRENISAMWLQQATQLGTARS